MGSIIETDSDHTVMLGLIACAVAASSPNSGSTKGLSHRWCWSTTCQALVGDTNSFDISEARKLEKKEREAEAVSTMEKQLFADTPGSCRCFIGTRPRKSRSSLRPVPRQGHAEDHAHPQPVRSHPKHKGKTKADTFRSHATQPQISTRVPRARVDGRCAPRI